MGDKLKIGQIVSFGVGGADKCALNLIKGLISLNENIELTVFYNTYSHPREDESKTNPSRFEEYKSLPVKLIEFTDVSELNNYDIDILHTHRSGNDNWFLPNFEKVNFKFKIIETNFHGYNQTKSDYRVYPSKDMISRLQPCNIPYSIIPNPILTPLSENDLKKELGISDKFVYGRIGRPDSNIYSSINLKAYKAIENDETCFLYVAPNNMAIMEAKSLGIKNILFLDATSDELMVSKLYNTFDVLCHSNSLGETFGNTIAEAMIHGKPIITHIGTPSWSQAHSELVGELTELFLTENIQSNYSELMLKLKNDKEYYNKVSSYLKNRADMLYSYDKVSRNYLNLYYEIRN
jgi:glycosyltransferase involved in cell wall biosynthesis